MCNFTNETLEGKLPNKELGGLLITTNFTKSDGSGAETMGLLYASGGGLFCNESYCMLDDNKERHCDISYRSGLPGSLGGELFTRCLT